MATKEKDTNAASVEGFLNDYVRPQADTEIDDIAAVCGRLVEQCPAGAQEWLLEDILGTLFEHKSGLTPAYEAFTALDDSRFGESLARYADTEHGQSVLRGVLGIAQQAQGPAPIDEYLQQYLPER